MKCINSVTIGVVIISGVSMIFGNMARADAESVVLAGNAAVSSQQEPRESIRPQLRSDRLGGSQRERRGVRFCDGRLPNETTFTEEITLGEREASGVESGCSGGDTEDVWLCWNTQLTPWDFTAVWITEWNQTASARERSRGIRPMGSQPTLQAFARDSSGELTPLGRCVSGVGSSSQGSIRLPNEVIEENDWIYFRLGATGNRNGELTLRLDPIMN